MPRALQTTRSHPCLFLTKWMEQRANHLRCQMPLDLRSICLMGNVWLLRQSVDGRFSLVESFSAQTMTKAMNVVHWSAPVSTTTTYAMSSIIGDLCSTGASPEPVT